MFGFRRKRFSGSYVFFSVARRRIRTGVVYALTAV